MIPGLEAANNDAGLAQSTMAVATQKLSFKMSIAVFFDNMVFFPFLFRQIQRGQNASACSKGNQNRE
jgi:hypothetical protein